MNYCKIIHDISYNNLIIIHSKIYDINELGHTKS
jgi:hypothetical protein